MFPIEVMEALILKTLEGVVVKKLFGVGEDESACDIYRDKLH